SAWFLEEFCLVWMGGMGLHSCIAQVDFERKHGKSSFGLLSNLSCGLAFHLAYSYIRCTDVSWPASYYDADTGTQGQHRFAVDPAEYFRDVVGSVPTSISVF
ncbi:hypothetical protein MTR67_030968, partial [Solanum verrucosum]